MLQGKRGGLKDTLPDDMMEAVFRATIQRTGINPAVNTSACPLHQPTSFRHPWITMLSGLLSCTPPMPLNDISALSDGLWADAVMSLSS